MTDKKISYISFLQIIGPVFVVLGHSLNGLDSTGWWYVFTKEWIYIFHMPLFFLISGYLLSFKGYLRGRSYGEFLIGKAKRLLLPYVCWNLLFCIPKLMAQAYISDKAPETPFDMLIAFLFPRQNVWGHTWFLMGLFIIYTAAPVFEKVLTEKNRMVPVAVVAICVFLYILPIQTEFLAFSDLHKDVLFFVLGCLLGQMPKETFLSCMKKQRWVFVLLGLLTSAAAIIWYEQTKPFHFIPCAFLLLSFLSIGSGIQTMPRALEKLAANSFGIYILHWPIMILVRIVMHQLFGFGVPLTALVMSVLGWSVPVLIVGLLQKLPWKKCKKPLKYLLGV